MTNASTEGIRCRPFQRLPRDPSTAVRIANSPPTRLEGTAADGCPGPKSSAADALGREAPWLGVGLSSLYREPALPGSRCGTRGRT